MTRVVGYHQPNFFPWIGYFHKVSQCNHFVTAVSVQYNKRGYQNRTRIRTHDGLQWLTVPVISKGRFEQDITDVQIDNSRNWRGKHVRTIEQHYSKAKYFDKYWPKYKKIYSREWEMLSSFNLKGISQMLTDLGINGIDVKFYMDWEFKASTEPDSTDRIVGICKACLADKYLSGRSGLKYMDGSKFYRAGIEVEVQKFIELERKQVYEPFLPAMSALDIIFNLGPDAPTYLRMCNG